MDLNDYKTFKRICKDYWWFKGKRDLLHRLLKKYSTNKQNLILDVGVGTGEDIGILEKFGEVKCIDTEKELLNILPKKYSDKVIIGDITEYEFKDEEFDIIVVLDVLEHIKDDKKAVQNLHRILKKKGILITTVPAYQSLYGPMDRHEQHYRRYYAKRFKKLFKGKFKILNFSYWNFFLFFPLATLKLFKKFFSKKESSSDFKELPSLINKLFFTGLKIENYLIGKKVCLPWGISIVCVMRKK